MYNHTGKGSNVEFKWDTFICDICGDNCKGDELWTMIVLNNKKYKICGNHTKLDIKRWKDDKKKEKSSHRSIKI